MKNKFKQSEIDKIPEDWDAMKLGDITALFHNGIWGDDPMPNFISYPVIRSTEITCDGKIDLSTVAYRKIPEDKVNKFTLDEGDILLVSSSGSPDLIGRAALFRQPDDDRVYLFSNFMLRIRPQKIDPNFLFYLLSSQHYYHFLKSLQQTSTGLRNLPKKNFLNFAIPYPSLPEQQKIAEILGTVDEVIEKVGKAIEKTERLKKGLMQELLTKGISHKEFKDTEIGKIPRGWEVRRLEEVTEINKESIDPRREVPTQKFLYIDIDSIENEIGKIKSAKEIVGKDAPSRARRVVYHDDVIMSTVRPYLKAFAIVPKEYDNQVCSTGFAVFTCREKLLPVYLLYTLFSKVVINQCNRMMVGGQYPALNSTQVAKIKIPYPPLSEQQKITDTLLIIDRRQEVLKKKRQKFERVKKGLMNELLTGEKRVRPVRK